MEKIHSLVKHKSAEEVAELLYTCIDTVQTTKFVAILKHVVLQTQNNTKNWDLNYIFNIWVKQNNTKRTLLYSATYHNNLEIVKCLLECGVKNQLNIADTSAVLEIFHLTINAKMKQKNKNTCYYVG